MADIQRLPFKEFQFHGFEGKRRVVSFGWRYDFSQHRALPADPIPAFLRQTCLKVQTASGFPLPELEQVLGRMTLENEILKKASSRLGLLSTRSVT